VVELGLVVLLLGQAAVGLEPDQVVVVPETNNQNCFAVYCRNFELIGFC